MQLSETEENYIKAIFYLGMEDKTTASTNAIAERLNTTAASVSDMLKKLAEKELVHYKKYKGVELTEFGRNWAINLVRKHRLWEVFLVDKLGFSWNEVHEIAEQLEHIKSSELVDKLDAFLSYPKFDPHGDPIPDALGNMAPSKFQEISVFSEGKQVMLMGVSDSSDNFLTFLNQLGLQIGTIIQIGEHFPYDNSRKLFFNNKEHVVSVKVLKQLLVKEV